MTANGNARDWGRNNLPSPYEAWQKSEGIPIYTGSYVTDLKALELAPWARVGQKGAFVNLAEQEEDDGRVIEIAPGGQNGAAPSLRGYRLRGGRTRSHQLLAAGKRQADRRVAAG
jgi:hypothetical protein